jgi:transposase
METEEKSLDLEKLRLRTPERRQVEMRMECVDDLVPPEDPVRLIWAATGRLDLSKFYVGIRACEGQVGRDATDPRLLVALWLYAATHGVGSARELARLCQEHRAYVWLCGGVSLNYHTLSDFRVQHREALDGLLTRMITTLVNKGLVEVWRISQDGTRIRACAGNSSFRSRDRLQVLYEQAKVHVEELRRQEDATEAAQLTARQRAALERAVCEREKRMQEALDQLPDLDRYDRHVSAEQKAKRRATIRVSTTDAQARVMKMGDGGFRPAYNVQLACDPKSRAIVGVEVTNQGSDNGQSEAMRQQVEQRSGQTVKEHLLDRGYLNFAEIERAEAKEVALYVPPIRSRNSDQDSSAYEPRPGESPAVAAWRQRMGSAEGQEVYKLRAASIETVNGDLKCHRGLGPVTVRGLDKVRCVALWSVLAYNLLHFGPALLG